MSYTILASDTSIIVNATATATLVFPSAASFPGRLIYVKSITAFAVNSSAANVVPLGSATPGTAILDATVGAWAWLQSDGSNWVIMAASEPVTDNDTQSAPTTQSGSYTVAAADVSIIASAALTLTLPSPSANTGRWLYIKNTAAAAVISASSNVCPLGSATAGTSILSANAGRWAALQSDGTNWIVMMGVV